MFVDEMFDDIEKQRTSDAVLHGSGIDVGEGRGDSIGDSTGVSDYVVKTIRGILTGITSYLWFVGSEALIHYAQHCTRKSGHYRFDMSV